MSMPSATGVAPGTGLIPLSLRIPLLLLLGMAVLLSYLYWDSLKNDQRAAESIAQERLMFLAASLQDNSEYYLREGVLSRVQAQFSALSVMPEIALAVLTDEGDRIIAATQVPTIGRQLGTALRDDSYKTELAKLRYPGWSKRGGRSVVSADQRAVLAIFPVRLDIRGKTLRPETTGTLLVVQDLSYLLGERHALSNAWLGRVALLLLLVLVFVSLTAHFLVTRRIGTLLAACRQLQQGDYTATANISGNDEIGYLGSVFDGMVVALAQSTGELRKLSGAVEQSASSIIVTDRRGVIEYVNPYFCSVTGYTPEEAIGKPVSLLKSGETSREQYGDMWQTLHTGGTWRGEMHNRRKDGSLYWDFATIAPVCDVAGNITHFVAVQEDITARKENESRLRLFARVFESVNEGIVVTDATKRIVLVNPAFSLITGYSAEEVTGRNPSLLQSGLMEDDFYTTMWNTIDEKGCWQGEIVDRRKDGSSYTQWLSITTLCGTDGSVDYYIGVTADVSERKLAEQRMAYLAQHDFLTGLANRAVLHDRLAQALAQAAREHGRVAVMFLDLDRFKGINDTLGHALGDRLLQEIAHRIRSVVRAGDTVCRQGGDEFVIMLARWETLEDIVSVAQKLLHSISRACVLEGNVIEVSTSIGISVFPEDGSDSDELLKQADMAMYHAKETGRNKYNFFTADMNLRANERMLIERKLRRALERQEFVLQYQPQFELETGRITGVEALLRWNDPETGIMLPDKFITIAEELGLIIQIGEWVLREAIRQNLRWRKMDLPHIVIAVNLSPVQFRQKGLGDTIIRTVRESGLDPAALELEITEGTLMDDPAQAILLMGQIKAQGIILSMDDFGTGYSSLSYLKRFPIDKLKIDQSFVRDIGEDPDDAAIVKTIISMAHSLKLKVIAEGVETAEQLAYLREHGCDEMQGFYLSKPLSAADLTVMLDIGKLPITS